MKIVLPRPVKEQNAVNELRSYGHDLCAVKECDQIDFDLHLYCRRCGTRINLSWWYISPEYVEYTYARYKQTGGLVQVIYDGPEMYCERLRALWG